MLRALTLALLLGLTLAVAAPRVAPGVVVWLEPDTHAFYWVGEQASGAPSLTRGVARPIQEASVGAEASPIVGAYQGDITALVESVRAKGRIEDLHLVATEGRFRLWMIWDDLPTEARTYRYVVVGGQVYPMWVLYHGLVVPLPEYGLRSRLVLLVLGGLAGGTLGGTWSRLRRARSGQAPARQV